MLAADGNQIDYTFTVTNTGNVALSEVALSEVRFSGKGAEPTITCPAGSDTLQPGATVVCTATYRLVEADRGTAVTNTAAVTGRPPMGTAVKVASQADVPVPPKALAHTGGSITEPSQLYNWLGLISLIAAAYCFAFYRRLRRA